MSLLSTLRVLSHHHIISFTVKVEYKGLNLFFLQVLKDMMTAIDVDDSGTVTLAEWLKGGMNNVPLLVLLGLKVAHLTVCGHSC